MEQSDQIIFHATIASLHLRTLAAMKLPCVSSTSQALMEDTAQMLDGLIKMHTIKPHEGRSEG